MEVPIYDYSIHNRSQATTLVEPKKVVIVEGILILENKELRDEMDLKYSWTPMPTSVSCAVSSVIL